jgi:hypothetical protein
MVKKMLFQKSLRRHAFLSGRAVMRAEMRLLMANYHARGGNALALRFQAKATVGLFFARNSDVTDGVFHGVAPKGGDATMRARMARKLKLIAVSTHPSTPV